MTYFSLIFPNCTSKFRIDHVISVGDEVKESLRNWKLWKRSVSWEEKRRGLVLSAEESFSSLSLFTGAQVSVRSSRPLEMTQTWRTWWTSQRVLLFNSSDVSKRRGVIRSWLSVWTRRKCFTFTHTTESIYNCCGIYNWFKNNKPINHILNVQWHI